MNKWWMRGKIDQNRFYINGYKVAGKGFVGSTIHKLVCFLFPALADSFYSWTTNENYLFEEPYISKFPHRAPPVMPLLNASSFSKRREKEAREQIESIEVKDALSKIDELLE